MLFLNGLFKHNNGGYAPRFYCLYVFIRDNQKHARYYAIYAGGSKNRGIFGLLNIPKNSVKGLFLKH